MTQTTDQERALASLRHLYQQMANGMVKDSAQAKRIAEGLLSPAIAKLEQAARRAPAAPSTWKDHDTAKLVNDLRECAVQYHAAGQLRERIAHLVRPLAARLACAPAAPVPQSEPVAYLWQHCETGRTRVVMPDMVVTADANWIVVGPLYLAAAPRPPVAAPVELPEPVAIVTGTTPRDCGWKTFFVPEAGTKLYTEQQVRDLLAAHGIQEQST